MKSIGLLIAAGILASGCTTAAQHRADVQDNSADRVTVGTVQKEVFLGMSGAAVMTALGSPNIVSTDEQRDEVWVYDRLATDVVYSESRGGVLGVIVGGSGHVGAGGLGAKAFSSGARSQSQRTLTIVIKFDAEQRVKDFAYHTSRF